MEQQQDLLSKPGNQPQNLPNATASLVFGIISIVGLLCYMIPGLICGIIGLVLSSKDRKLYNTYPDMYSAASYSTSNAGRICSIIGLCLAAVLLLIIIIALILGLSIMHFQRFH